MDRAGDEGGAHLTLPSATIRRWPDLGRLAVALAVAAIVVVDWPVVSISPLSLNGTDGSWQMMVHLWGHSLPGLGPHTEFTYGPLGFLALPTLWWTTTGVMSWVVVLPTTAACAVVAIRSLRSWLPLPGAVVVAFVLVRELILLDGAVAAWPLFALWAVVDARPDRLRHRVTATVALAALADVLLMCKFGDGLVLAAVAVLAPLIWGARPWRELAAGVATLTIGLWALWSVLTLAPWQLGHYVTASLRVAAGYWAMTVPGATAYLVFALTLGPIVVGLALATTPRRRAAWVAVLYAIVLWLEFKHAFIRADGVHVPTYFVTVSVAVLGGLLGTHAYVRLARVAVALLAVVLAVLTSWARSGYEDVSAGARRFVDQVPSIVAPSRQQAIGRDARRLVREHYALPPSLVDALRRGTVQVDPYDEEIGWAYGLRLRPVPVFQLYGSYTTALDTDNVRALLGDRAPHFVLRRLSAGGLDGRAVEWDSPSYQVALVCHYREVMRVGVWQLLERTASSMCGARQRLETVSLRQRVTVPPSDGSELVVATFHLHPTAFERLRRLLFRETAPTVLIGARRRHPFVLGTAGAMHLVTVPPGGPVGPRGEALVHIPSFRLFGSGMSGTVTFWSIPFHPQTAG